MVRSDKGKGTSRRSVLKAMAATGLVPAGAYKAEARSDREQGEGSNKFENVVPTPIKTKTRPTEHTITEDSAIAVRSDDAQEVGEYLAGMLRPATGYELPIIKGPLRGRAGGIELRLAGAPNKVGEEGYRLNVTPRSVRIRANQPAGLFNGVQTLRQLLPAKVENDTQQSGSWTVPGGQIIDYPELPIRGAIEGFYGPPWSHEDRLRQLEFYGEYKMNSYIYAPKDDPYHREEWREPYPSDDLNKLKDLVKTARRNYVEFTFALSPGQSICYSSDDDFQALINKFESMYDIGIRSFYIAFDDINYTDWECEQDPKRFGTGGAGAGKAQAHLLNKVQKQFVEAHEDVEPLQMVPTEYHSVSESSYKQALREELDSDVLVQWTGTAVVAEEITQDQAEAAQSVFGHSIFVWDNYPVNDYARDRLFLGPLTGRDPELDDHGLVGLTSNPMNEAEASKIALITVADYMWNSSAYKPVQTWEQALRKFGDNAYEPLRTFAENTRSTPLKGSLSESPELSKLIEEFWTAFEAGDFTSEADALSEEFATIEGAPQKLRDQLNNDEFLEEVEPWFKKAELTGAAGQLAVSMVTSQRTDNGEEVWQTRRDLHDTLDDLDDNEKMYAPDVAAPFFQDALAANDQWFHTEPSTNLSLDGTATQSSDLFFNDGYPFPASNAIDDNLSNFSHTKFEEQPWWQIDLNSPNFINSINIWNREGYEDRVSDYYVLVSNEPFESNSLKESLKQPGVWSVHHEEAAGRPTETKVYGTAQYIRIWLSGSNALNISEVQVIGRPDEQVLTVSGAPPATKESRLILAADGGIETSYVASRPPKADEALVVSEEKAKHLSSVTIIQSTNRPATADIQVKMSNGSWRTIGALNGSYTKIEANNVATDSIRIAWAEDSNAPIIHEVIPRFNDS